MGFSRQKYWDGLAFPSPGDLPDPGIETASPVTPAMQANSLLLSHQGCPYNVPERKTPMQYTNTYIWNLDRWQ